ncbi:hypothetical protein [Marinimicrobium sp. C6131]|uniref:hypothetical protein n=1 Tax=unclassified Marinimicrobium TaxID=2632100 RepID=UPI00223D7B1F|nr:hypothetical protein [Marinimicrobium sp. C6131]UZJ44414.1 hypothetical protein OOT55_17415 [Marinimicrobium sp. C6131]
MLYENNCEYLLGFIDNPIKNGVILEQLYKKPSLKGRLLFKIPMLRRFVSEEDLINIFTQLLVKLRKGAQKELLQLKLTDLEPSPHNLDRCINALAQHYVLATTPITSKEGGDIEFTEAFLLAHYAAKSSYHTSRISESLGLPPGYDLPISESPHLWALYHLSEVYWLLKSRFYRIKASSNSILLYRNSTFSTFITTYWASELLEYHSQLADMAWLISRFEPFMNTRIPPLLFVEAVDRVLDKAFSISQSCLTSELRRQPKYKLIRDLIGLAVLIEARSRHSDRIEKSWIHRQRLIPDETIEFIDGMLDQQPPQFGLASNFISLKGDHYHRGTLQFRYGIRKLMGYLHPKYYSPEDTFINGISKAFENHILNHLKGLQRYGYTAYEGLAPPGPKAAITGYDVDVILHDTEKSLFFFIQIKYKLTWTPTYLSEQIKFFANDGDDCRKGYRQLKVLRDNMMHQSIRDRLKRTPAFSATPENSHFIVLHNQPFLNLYTHDEIHFYDWNTFRNILENGSIIQLTNNDEKVRSIGERMPIHRPDNIAARYIESGAFGETTKEQYDLFMNATCNVNVDDICISSSLL